MRRMLVAAMIMGVASSASASTPYERLMAPYLAELGSQCPDKHLELLAPADLRDALDDFKAHLPREQQARMDKAEASHCANSIAGTSCANSGDITVAEKLKLTSSVAAKVCGSFKLCRKQSDCD